QPIAAGDELPLRIPEGDDRRVVRDRHGRELELARLFLGVVLGHGFSGAADMGGDPADRQRNSVSYRLLTTRERSQRRPAGQTKREPDAATRLRPSRSGESRRAVWEGVFWP